MHRTIEPTILYFGTPVAVISTLNEDGTANIAPMSSAWWLGWSCMLGLGTMGKTSENLIRTRECVINLPSEKQVGHVDRLALTTGKDPVPEKKKGWGYRYEADKFGVAGLTPMSSLVVGPPRIAEFPIQMEGVVHDLRPFGETHSQDDTQSDGAHLQQEPNGVGSSKSCVRFRYRSPSWPIELFGL
jgi:flavin reductase (DIM6/NTAB) family NADH-FMN oxidoreductase RutF